MSKFQLMGSIAIACLLGVLMAYAGGDHGIRLGAVSVFMICVLLSFAINWLAFIPASIAQTEHYYDITGCISYIAVILMAVALSQPLDARSLLVTLMVMVWSVRLGLFLFTRVRRTGKDDRFDEMKVQPLRFLLAWTIQALWVVITSACALVIITNQQRVGLSWFDTIGIFVWLCGFTIEVVADRQKSVFKKNPANSGKFIDRGLWAWSQHPNYFGEIVLWFGVALLALPVLSGLQWFCLISPVFVYLLIRYVSGVNMLQEKGLQTWGNDPAYLKRIDDTPLLLPKPPTNSSNS